MANIEVEKSDIDNTNEQLNVPSQEVSQSPEVPKRNPGRKVIFATVLLVIAALAFGLVLVLQDRNELKQEVSKLSQSQVNATDEAKQLSAEVSKHIELPSDEVPTVAAVVDADKVKNQPFFVKAQNGDKVLLYAKSGKAVLYRPSVKKIIEVAPINIGSNQGSTGTKAN